MKIENIKNNIDEYFDSDRANNFFKRLGDKKKMKDSQLEKFHQKVLNNEIDFDEIVIRVCQKYNSDDYYFRWINRGIMPQEMLYFFLFDFASVYGRELSNEEYEKFANDFESGIYIFRNYVFQKMNGQGTCIKIDEIK